MSRFLDAEIARINKMRLSAEHRTQLVKRTKAIVACLNEPEAPPVDHVWCSRCGFLLADHDRLVVQFKAHHSDPAGGGA